MIDLLLLLLLLVDNIVRITNSNLYYYLLEYFHILSIIERSTFIPSSEYRIRIIALIIDTMDDFRLRLSQMIHSYEERWPFSKKFYSILNTFDFLMALSNEWQSNSVKQI